MIRPNRHTSEPLGRLNLLPRPVERGCAQTLNLLWRKHAQSLQLAGAFSIERLG